MTSNHAAWREEQIKMRAKRAKEKCSLTVREHSRTIVPLARPFFTCRCGSLTMEGGRWRCSDTIYTVQFLYSICPSPLHSNSQENNKIIKTYRAMNPSTLKMTNPPKIEVKELTKQMMSESFKLSFLKGEKDESVIIPP